MFCTPVKLQCNSRCKTALELWLSEKPCSCEPLKNVMMFFLPAMVESTYCKLRKWKTIAAASWHFVWNFLKLNEKSWKIRHWKSMVGRWNLLLERPGLFSGPMLPLQAAMGHWPTHLLVRSIGVPTCIASSRVGQMTLSGWLGFRTKEAARKIKFSKKRVVSSIILLMEEILHLEYSKCK